jgi:hypothetical protein
MRNFVTVFFTKYHGDHIRQNEVGYACSTRGRDVKYVIFIGNTSGEKSRGRLAGTWEG